MSHPTLAAIPGTVADLNDILSRLRMVLAGRRTFSITDLKAADELLKRMAPLVKTGADENGKDPYGELKEYAALLKEFDLILEKLRFMLVARKTQLENARNHLSRTKLWAEAFQQTQ